MAGPPPETEDLDSRHITDGPPPLAAGQRQATPFRSTRKHPIGEFQSLARWDAVVSPDQVVYQTRGERQEWTRQKEREKGKGRGERGERGAQHLNQAGLEDGRAEQEQDLPDRSRLRHPSHLSVDLSKAEEGRDSSKDVDVEADLTARIREGLLKAKECNDRSRSLGQKILALEEEVRSKGKPTLEQHKELDTLYRENLKAAEDEKKVHDDYDIVNNLAILQSLKAPDEPAPRNGTTGKSRKEKRSSNDAEAAADSPGASLPDNVLKRVKGTAQRSSSSASSARSAIVPKTETDAEQNRGLVAEKNGQLVVGTEVFYRTKEEADGGVGIQGTIRKVSLDKKPITYDVEDPPDESGETKTHKAFARDLIPISSIGIHQSTIPTGTTVFAKYPETDTFYKAVVKGMQRGTYVLIFEGEEGDREMHVDKRYVLDAKLK